MLESHRPVTHRDARRPARSRRSTPPPRGRARGRPRRPRGDGMTQIQKPPQPPPATLAPEPRRS
ncbi:hypothetical protein O1L55_10780, partial [Streptomyces albulus]|nr:hypothetical protein [Streptomyces noursei]